jgi:tetratricopeptide (TPR) repeat protein
MGLAVAVAVSLVATSSVNHWAQRLREAEVALSRIPEHGPASPAVVSSLEHALALARSTPGGGPLARRLALELHRARSITAADRLRSVVDRLRFESAADAPDPAQVRTFLALCRDVWATRGLFLDANGQPIRPDLDRQVREDLLDLAILSAELAMRALPGDAGSTARRDALKRFDEAEALLGTRADLERQRAALAEAEGLEGLARAASARAAAHPPAFARDDYHVGLSLLRGGDVESAAKAFERASRAEPQSFWPNFHRGLCAERTSRHLDAVEAFSMCIAARPDSAPCYAHRARASQALGRLDRAGRDYDRALELDPRVAATWINRGISRLGAGRHHEAIADLKSALSAGGDPATVHYHLALTYRALGNQTAARSHAQVALNHNSAHAAAYALLAGLDDE